MNDSTSKQHVTIDPQLLQQLGVVDALLPAVRIAAQLRACGISIVATPEAIDAFYELATEIGDDPASLDVQLIVQNILYNEGGVIEGSEADRLRAAQAGKRKSWWRWPFR